MGITLAKHTRCSGEVVHTRAARGAAAPAGRGIVDGVGFWDGVHTLLLDGDGIAFKLPDGRIMSVAEMDRRERAYKAGRDPDEPFSPRADRVDQMLGAIIMRERQSRRLSQRQLALESGVTQSMVARLEAGSREPSWRTFRLLLDAMALEPVVETQTTAPSSSSSGSAGGPGRML